MIDWSRLSNDVAIEYLDWEYSDCEYLVRPDGSTIEQHNWIPYKNLDQAWMVFSESDVDGIFLRSDEADSPEGFAKMILAYLVSSSNSLNFTDYK